MKFFVACLLSLVCGAVASPVEQVVQLLTKLKNDAEADGGVEQQVYDKYACWCENTSKRKAADIVTAGEDLRSLGQRILKLKGKIATRAAEIAELSENIKSNEDEQEELTAVRQKENAAWMAESAETKEALTALQSAITVLAKATTPGKGALLQESEGMLSKQAVKSVLEALPLKMNLKPKQTAFLNEFVSAKAGYAPQSATIQGMLADMYLTMSSDLESDTNQEATSNKNFEQTFASLEKENNAMKETKARKETEKAEAEAMLADTTKAYDDTEKQMKADTKFFDQVKAGCESKHEEWELRDKLRKEEIDGIDKALEILTSDDARALFAKSIKPGVETFLQIASSPTLLQDSANLPAAKAYTALRSQVVKTHSVRLAALAVQVRTAKFGHFEGVIKAIDDMIKTLQEEGAADLAKKTQCLDQYQKVTKTVNDLDWQIDVNEAKIEKLDKLIELRTKEKAETIEKIKNTEDYLKQIADERKAEHEAFQKAKKDDEDAIALLEKARDAMAKYYKSNKIDQGEIQGSVKLLQEEPVFERSADDAPDADFSGKGSRKGQSKNILSLMAYIIEDLQDEVSNGRKSEVKSQTEYEEERDTAEQLKKDLEEKKVTLEGIIAKRNTDKEEENKDMKANNKDRTSELDYKKDIKPDCDWILKAFDGRADARAAEMNGLTTAKEFLAGQSSLLDQTKKFDDSKLGRMNFLGVSH